MDGWLLKGDVCLTYGRSGAGDAFKNYLRFNDVWKRLKRQQGVVPYSFRHSNSKRAHQIYKLNDTEVAAFMNHSVPVHNATYAQWSTESMLESSMDRAIKFRDLNSK
jgi:integrase